MSNLLWICIEEESAVDAFTIIISCLVGKMSFVSVLQDSAQFVSFPNN